MGFEFYKESYAGAVKEISIGQGAMSVKVGGETCYPFYQFEGSMPNKPKIAMEIWDTKPLDWPKAALSPFIDVVEDPALWAKKCVDVYGAEIIVLQLKSTDPNGINASPESASMIVQKVLKAINVPLILWGIANADKDEAVFKKIAEDCQDYDLTFGPVEDKNHKSIGAAAIGYGHHLISSSPIDVNLAKQVNILLENLGMPMDHVFIDPTTGGLGYGLEYSYSVMERLRIAALTQGDDKLQMPIINNLGNEIWKCKEVKGGIDDAPNLGDPERRGILMESVAAVTYLMAGSDILIMRHPESIRMVKNYIELLMNGGSAIGFPSISKLMEDVKIDFKALSIKPDLTIDEKKIDSVIEKENVSVDEGVSDLDSGGMSVETDKKVLPSGPDVVVKSEIEKASVKIVKESNDIVKDADVEIPDVLEVVENKIDLDDEIHMMSGVEDEKKLEIDNENLEYMSKVIVEENELRNKRKLECEERLIANRDKNKVAIKMTASVEQKSMDEKIIDRLMWIHRKIKLYKW